jgi:ABC-type Fe3+-hydroxamate transport system substrate-binding protein
MVDYRDVTDAVLKIESPPQRIVSLVPSVTETLFDLGAAMRIVGRTRYCVAPDPEVRTIEKVGGTKDPDVAKIAALKPDLVLANREENRKSDIEQLRSMGIPVYVDEPLTVEQGLASVSLLGRILDCENEADHFVRRGVHELSEISTRLSELEQENKLRLKPRKYVRPRVLAFIWKDPWMVAGPRTYIGDMLTTLGGTLALDGSDVGQALRQRIVEERYFRVEPIEVATLAPDILLFPDEPYTFTEGDFALWREKFPQLPAVAAQRLRLCSGQDLAWYGSRIPGALVRLQPMMAW